MTNPPLPATISDLWQQDSSTWDHQLVTTTFLPPMAQKILSTPIIQAQQPDRLRWAPAASGKCSTAAAYSYLANLQQHSLPSQGARSISPQVKQILQKVWKAKTIPPFLKTFAWRLIRRALTTAERAGRFSTKIDQHCSYCGLLENDNHLFFFYSVQASLELL